MFKCLALIIAVTAAIGCTASSGSIPGRAAEGSAPRGATIGPEGFATILDAPPAPFATTAPQPPQAMSPDQLAAHEQFRKAAEFQNRVREDVQALADKLRVAEKGNFVDLYYENEGEPHVVFRFLRNGRSTLAKYTKNPLFVATDVRYSRQELEAAMDFMLQTFREDRVVLGGGTGSKCNCALVDIAITEPELRALVEKKGVKIPEAVKLSFVAKQPASALNQPLPDEIARLVRIFPRADRPVTLLPAVESRAKVVLEDGCFRLVDQGSALALFPLGSRLFIDHEGFLAFGAGGAPGYARVGEEVVFPGIATQVTAKSLVEPIHAACGPGKVMQIFEMKSAAANSAQNLVDSNAQALRELRRSYGLSEEAAHKALKACRERTGSGNCILSPPPPVRSQQDCPAETKLSFGLCRTGEGFIRPLPKWLEGYARS
jgi:hypothetical protein